MKKRTISFAILIILVALGYSSIDITDIDLTGLTSITSAIVQDSSTSSVMDSGAIQVYFCPHQDCEGNLVSFIESAQKSVSCALFDVGLESVQEVLLEKYNDPSIEVRIVTDNDYIEKFDHEFVREDTWGLMHNKFCIIDGVKLSTGSMNPTNNGAHKNNNNLLLIESDTLASNYLAEFNEMWQGTFKKGNPVAYETIELTEKNITLHNYFCPDDSCADHIKEILNDAEKSIHFMTFSFTHDGIANVLLIKHEQGLVLQGVMEARQVSKYSKYDVLKFQDIDVLKDGNKQNMHHKVFIVDEKIVITGSMNPSAGGDTRNDENVLVIEDEAIAKVFLEEFNRVYEQAEDNLS